MNLSSLPELTKLPFHGVILPSITISHEDHTRFGSTPGCSNAEFLHQLCVVGFRQKIARRIPKLRHQEYGDRVKLELDTINSLGFTNYILMVWDICQFADRAGIPRGPGRGSVSSSLVSHLIGITELDPIENGLFFTRFLSKSRAKTTVHEGVTYVDGSLVPDVDMDFDYYRREEVFEYLAARYPGQTAHTLTTGTLTSKALLIDLVKTYEGGSKEEAQAAANLINVDAGVPEEVEHALYGDTEWREKKGEKGKEPNVAFKDWATHHPEVCELAMDMTGLNRSEGQHASAFLICATKIDELMPLQSAVGEDEKRHRVSGFDMYSAQEIVLKFDILGLKTLSVINGACKRLGITPQDIDVHHESIYRELQDFKNRYGIFQLETFAQGSAATKVKPRTFDQLAAVLAIARPGAIAYLPQYVKYVNEGVFTSVHPLIDDILEPSGGVATYQEQMIAMLKRIGMDDDAAERIRKILAKKEKEKVADAMKTISEVCAKNNRPPEIVNLLLEIAENSGSYAFSKCLAPDTVVETPTGYELMYNIRAGDKVLAYDVDSATDHFVEVVKVHESETELFEVEFMDGRTLCCSIDHKLLCSDGVMRTLEVVLREKHEIVTD